jgi:DNA-binding transcriptional LysR family regulator
MDKLNLMASFIAVVEEGNFTAAARRIGKTTALVSTHISQLEENLDVQLVTRTTRSIKLTSTGLNYYEEAKRVLDDIASLEAKVRQEHESLVGEIRITAPTTFGELVLAPLFADMIKNHPQLQIDLSLNDRFVDIVAEGFDMAIRIGQLEDSALIARKISTTKMVLCASPALIEKHGQPESPEDLQNLPCIFDTNNRYNYWSFKDGKKILNIKPNSIMKVNSAVAAGKLACAGLGICSSPQFAVQDALDIGNLVTVLDEFNQTEIPINVIYSHRKHLSAKVSAVLELIRESLRGC